MKLKGKKKTIAKKTLATVLSAAIIASNGYGLDLSKRVEAQAATTTTSSGVIVLSNKDRNEIFNGTRTDFRDESIYFTMVTRFYNGDESNDVQCWDGTQYNLNDPAWRGDFKGLIEKLDYIKALGFTAIWITPVVENISGYDYHGYHASNFSKVDERYESDDCTYQDLIDACHDKGMKIIQDVVFNHTGNFGEANLCPMFEKVGDLSSPDCLQLAPGTALPSNYNELLPDAQYQARLALMKNTDGVNHDVNNIYHHYGNFNWDDWTCQVAQIAGDCVDLNTENPLVYNYLVDAYSNYIDMGVDGFRVDTVRHISRLTFNKVFNEAFKEAGRRNGKDFFMFGEVCTRDTSGAWYRNNPAMSTPFYTWKETKDYPWSDTDWEINYESAIQCSLDNADNVSEQPTSKNAFLNGNEYHETDYSEFSGLSVIDFPMHWSFKSAGQAFGVAKKDDKYYNDATWNVTYVDSHDYAPDGAPESQRFSLGQDVWAENLSLMFTFRGIPCIYYGSETEFQKGAVIDKGPNIALAESGRAYYGDNLEGNVIATGFASYGNVSGAIKDTLEYPLSQHIQRLNRLRQAIPALRKGQYSTEGVSGNLAFKRRYTDDTTDSFVCVSISGDSTFTGVPNGKYVDAVTGDVKNVTNGTLSVSVSGKGNLKAYVLDTTKTPAPGRVVTNGKYLTDGGAAELIEQDEVEIVDAQSVTLSKSSVTVLEGESEKVTATVLPENATTKTVAWTSSNTKVAAVSGGKITGVSVGTATITAKTTNGKTATLRVTVKENPNIIKPTGITLSDKEVTVKEKGTVTVTANVLPANATDKKVIWSSNDESVATVAGGVIKGVKEGTAIITASTSNGYTASVTVTVEKRFVSSTKIFFKNTGNWSSVCAYAWKETSPVVNNAAWPGEAMTCVDEENKIYCIELDAGIDYEKIIFNNGGSSNKTGDLVIEGYEMLYDFGTSQWSDYIQTEQGTVNVKYVDEDGTVLISTSISGDVGAKYTTSAKTIDGYTLKTTPANASGTYTSGTITVTYVYVKNNVETPLAGTLKVNGSTGTVNLTKGDSVTLVPTATGGTAPYTYQYVMKVGTRSVVLSNYSTKTSYTGPLESTGTKVFTVNVKDSTGKVVSTNSVTVVVSSGVTALSASLKVNGQTGTINLTKGGSVTLTPSATGGSGSYTYQYLMKTSASGSSMTLKNYSASSSYTGPLTSVGTKIFTVNVKDSTGTIVATNSVTVVVSGTQELSACLKVNGQTGTINLTKGDSVKLVPTAKGGSGSYTYQYLMKTSASGSNMTLKNYSSATSYTGPLMSVGTKIFTVNVKDSTGTIVATNSVTVVVSKPQELSATLKVNGQTGTINLAKGGTVTLSPEVSGGTGTYTYQYLMKTSATGSNMVLKNYSSATSYTGPLVSAGTKIFTVNVKDSTGTVVATNTVTVIVK